MVYAIHMFQSPKDSHNGSPIGWAEETCKGGKDLAMQGYVLEGKQHLFHKAATNTKG